MAKRIELTAEPTTVSLMAGETAEVTAKIRNTGQTIDQLVLGIEGLDEAWHTIPVTSVALFPNDQDSLRISLHPPADAEAKAGSHKFRIVVRSHESPEIATAEVTLEIKQRLEVKLEISPDHIKGRKGAYQVMIANPTNRDLPVSLSAFDAKNRLRYKFNLNQMTVGGGSRYGATLQTRLRWFAWIGGEKEFTFHVAATPPGAGSTALFCPYCGEKFKGEGTRVACPSCGKKLVDQANIAEAELVRPAIISGLKIRFPWFSRTPRIESFTASTDNKLEFTLKWSVKKAKVVTLNGEQIPARGEMVVHPAGPFSYTLTATNKNKTTSHVVEVQPLTVPKPQTSERIRVSLSPAKVEAYAGNVPTTAILQIQNIGTIVDKFLVEVQGIDGSWYRRSASSVGLMPQASDQVQITFQPPKVQGVKSGTYAFAVVVRSESAPQEATVIPGTLEIMPAPEFKLQMRPTRAECRKKTTFKVVLNNTGVTDLTFKLAASDAEEGCQFTFKDEGKETAVSAWRTAEVPLIVKPKRGSFIGAIKRYDITVNATPSQGVALMAVGELNHSPLVRSWRHLLRVIRAIIIIAALIVGIWLAIHWGGGWHALTDSPRKWAEDLVDGTFAPW